MSLQSSWREAVLAPPLQTGHQPGTGGRIRRRAADFVVVELPAYEANGQPNAHVLLTLTKQGLSSEEAAVAVAKHLGIGRRELGMAGRKDRVAITTQWLSVPAGAAAGLASFQHEAITLGAAKAHGNKLRTGHLRGNRFTLVVRELSVPPPTAVERATATIAELAAQAGLANFFGPQRFGFEGRQLDRGLGLLRGGKASRRDNFMLSAGQSALFNLYALVRRERGQWRTVLVGDLLQKRDGGGMFECEDAATDQARLDAGQLRILGPMFGSRMRAPGKGTPSAALEADVLAMAEVEPLALASLGRSAVGTRRALTVELGEPRFEVAPAEPDAELGPGLRLAFSLPSGSYATQVCREVLGDDTQPANIDPR